MIIVSKHNNYLEYTMIIISKHNSYVEYTIIIISNKTFCKNMNSESCQKAPGADPNFS